MKKYSKNCPDCGELQYYKTNRTLKAAIKNNTRCIYCFIKGKNNPFYGKKHSEKSIQKMIAAKLGKNNPMYGKHHSEETKQKLRELAIKRIENNIGQVTPNYNPEACQILNEIMKEKKIFIQHAENGGEFQVPGTRFFVDGYDKENNVVYEYYEMRHKYQKEYDIKRKQNIIEHLKCKFIEIREWEL